MMILPKSSQYMEQIKHVPNHQPDRIAQQSPQQFHFMPICSMYGTFTNSCPKNQPNVGKYTIHGAYGMAKQPPFT